MGWLVGSPIERSRRRRCAAVNFDAANEARAFLGEVSCGAPPVTVAAVSGSYTQSTHLEPETVFEANEVAGLGVLPQPLAARCDFLEVGGGDNEIESKVNNGVHSQAKRNVTAVKDSSWWALQAHVSV